VVPSPPILFKPSFTSLTNASNINMCQRGERGREGEGEEKRREGEEKRIEGEEKRRREGRRGEEERDRKGGGEKKGEEGRGEGKGEGERVRGDKDTKRYPKRLIHSRKSLHQKSPGYKKNKS
jgi:hypothetical protein